MKAKPPKKTAEEKALAAAQARELDRTQKEIDEKKRRTLRAQYGSTSLLSGSERGVVEGETRLMRGSAGTSSLAGRTRGGGRRAGAASILGMARLGERTGGRR